MESQCHLVDQKHITRQKKKLFVTMYLSDLNVPPISALPFWK